MFQGTTYPEFFVYDRATNTLVTTDGTFALKKSVISRENLTYQNAEYQEHTNPLTKKTYSKFLGYRYKEILTVVSKNTNLDIEDWTNRQSDDDKRDDTHRLEHIMEWVNNPLYKVKYIPHNDVPTLLDTWQYREVTLKIRQTK
jgi:hypothetical protein